MTAEQILSEIEKLNPSERFQLAVELGKGIGDLRWLLCTHPDQKMVESSCLHFLGDAAQQWHAEWKAKQGKDLSVWEQILVEHGPLEQSDFNAKDGSKLERISSRVVVNDDGKVAIFSEPEGQVCPPGINDFYVCDSSQNIFIHYKDGVLHHHESVKTVSHP